MPSKKVLDQKIKLVADLKEKISNACAAVIVQYEGINVEDDTKLRRELRENNVAYTVVKNTMLSRAAKDAGIEGVDGVLHGTTAIALSNDDYVAAAKILCNFAKDHDFFKVKLGIIDNEVVDASKVIELSKLPPKEVLIAQVLGGLNAPISGFATVLNGTLKGLVVALNAIAEKQSA
ncbi:MAG: 50S ribosomal protein L10 [Clostridia bacterium]|nr:50S ribosomal protein L10 [Clostridia bacterium]